MYQAMNYADSVNVGVIKSGDDGFSWAVEPEWNWAQAQRMAAALNQNPDIDTDDLYKLAKVTI